ncbi:hypothetical protein NDN01_02005 [Sphingomonas sp. QA11]|uniref:hypothetical protein n=1 Tax=Sphingomonas sp. QA11 TaxID=2950605 RepID=UPI00234A4E84|nr:hypothetical protein [Sphingomonas sp. QA11]WCM27729.1 hypothetical protein NDN01_02005 [Sphingomonas sp. QA11]
MANPVPTTPALMAQAKALGQQAARLKQWHAASWSKATPIARHRFLANVHRAEAGAHQLAATGFAVAATPAGRADPQLRTALTGLKQVLGTLAQLDMRGPATRPAPTMTTPAGPRPAIAPRLPTMPMAGIGRGPSLPTTARPTPRWMVPGPQRSPVPIDAARPNGAAPGVRADELASLRRAATDAITRLQRGMSSESETEADHAMDPTSKRSRANKQASIGVDRTRTDRAQQRVKGAEDRARARQQAIALIRNRAPASFRKAMLPIVYPGGGVMPEVVDRLANLSSSNFIQQIVSLISSSDGGGTLDGTVISAVVASAVASAATELGIVDQVNTSALAKAVNAVVASDLSPAFKMLATVAAVVATGKKSGGKRQAELAP